MGSHIIDNTRGMHGFLRGFFELLKEKLVLFLEGMNIILNCF